MLRPGGRFVLTDMVLQGEEAVELRNRTVTTSGSFPIPCIAGAESAEGYYKILEQAGFQDIYSEDHSQELRKLAPQMISKYGSRQAFLDSLPGDSVSKSACEQLLRGRRLGYVLIAATSP